MYYWIVFKALEKQSGVVRLELARTRVGSWESHFSLYYCFLVAYKGWPLRIVTKMQMDNFKELMN